MKILIALDPTAPSERALDFVRRMRWPAGSRVLLASVLTPMTSPVATYEPILAGQTLLEGRRRRLEETVSRAELALRESGFCTEGRVALGDPRQALVDLAQQERVDLLVVGSHGRSGIAKLMLGSVSSHVVTHAPCSVLVVKRPDEPQRSGRREENP